MSAGVLPGIFPRICLLVVMAVVLGSCNAGPTNLIGLGEAELLKADTRGLTSHTIFLATTRTRSSEPYEFFSGERSNKMGLGNVTVTIPANHQIGKIEQPQSGKSDPEKHFTIRRPEIYSRADDFAAGLELALAEKPEGAREILIFVHGYNTNFSAAVLRVSQFVHDTGFKGVPLLFSWASRGKTMDYVYDINSALQARFYLEELALRLSRIDVDAFTIVAHSMGNLVTLEAMTALARRKEVRDSSRLKAVILAAPDVDFDLFVEQLDDLSPIKDRFYVFVSKDDKALTLSKRIAGGVTRVGAADPEKLAALGLKVVDLSTINDPSNANHSKFADSPAIVQLIGQGLKTGPSLSASGENTSSVTGLGGRVIGNIVRIPSNVASGAAGSVLTIDN
ncbi:MAG: alpha/beta hydrolase [Rhizobiaceae bacterium]